jgi:hypothetical protein
MPVDRMEEAWPLSTMAHVQSLVKQLEEAIPKAGRVRMVLDGDGTLVRA